MIQMGFRQTDYILSLIVKGRIVINCGGTGVENHGDVDRPNQKESMPGLGKFNTIIASGEGTEIKLDTLNGWMRQEVTVKVDRYGFQKRRDTKLKIFEIDDYVRQCRSMTKKTHKLMLPVFAFRIKQGE